eukprot:319114-Hanusia_phi.AAC.1
MIRHLSPSLLAHCPPSSPIRGHTAHRRTLSHMAPPPITLRRVRDSPGDAGGISESLPLPRGCRTGSEPSLERPAARPSNLPH